MGSEMRIIQNEFISFRCPNTLREQLETLAQQSDLHLSHLIRIACAQIVREAAETGAFVQRVTGQATTQSPSIRASE